MSRPRVLHLKERHPLWFRWQAMKQRCCNPKTSHYHLYGARGITVCERWRNSFKAYLEDMGMPPSPEHSLDRIDNDGNYCKENCRWATPIEQAANSRRRRLIAGSTVKKEAERVGIKRETLAARLRLGIPLEVALSSPVKTTGLRFALTLGGETKSKTEWARIAGITLQALSYRLASGWTLEEAVRTQRRPGDFNRKTERVLP